MDKEIPAKQTLLARLQKKDGVAANRKALKDLQNFFDKELPTLIIQKAKENAWK